MGLIKSTQLPSLSPFSMRDIEDQAQAILVRARQKAEELLFAAQAEADELKKAAHVDALSDGYREGLTRGLEQGTQTGREDALAEQRERLAELLTALSTAASGLDARRQELESAALQEVVELSIAIARRVTKRQGMLDPQVLAENLREAMKLAVNRADVRIAISPVQRQTLQEVLVPLRVQWPALAHIHIVEDASIQPGGCRIYTSQGEVDADLDRQLDRVIADVLPSVLEQEVAS